MKSAYVVLEVSDPDKLIPAIERLDSYEPVKRCDPVLGHAGHADLVLVVRGADDQKLTEMLQLDGLKRVNVLEIANDEEFAPAPEPLPIRAYVFMDTVPEQKEAVRDAILALPETVFCTRMATKCDLVAMVTGKSLELLKQTIREKIQALDGVLRLKPHYAFNIKEL